MPAKLTELPDTVKRDAAELGQRIRTRREALGVSVTSAAQAAGMSRVTWYRLEKGEAAVTLGTCLSAMSVLGLVFEVRDPSAPRHSRPAAGQEPVGWLPARVALADYPQLRQLAWQLRGIETLTPREALSLYERNWRHIDPDALEPREMQLVSALRLAFADEARDV